MQYNNYILDLDGTLLDTLGDLSNAVNYALRQHGLPEHSVDQIRWMVGNGVTTLVERAVGEAGVDLNALFETFKQYYTLHCMDSTAPYPGVCDMLARLKARGCRLAVVSNKLDKATKPLVQHFFGQWVDVAIGEHEGVQRKPAPDMVYEAMEQLGIGTEGTVYVGDSEVDLATAHNSGLPCISVLWGFRDREFLIQHGATTFVNSPDEIL